MVNLSGPVGVLSPHSGLRPQGQAEFFSSAKGPTKQESSALTLNAVSVTDVARPHRGGGRPATVAEQPALHTTDVAAAASAEAVEDVRMETAEPLLVRTPSGSKLVDPTTRFPFGACFTFWLRRGSPPGVKNNQDLYEIGSCTEVVDFWKYWNGIVLDRLPHNSLFAIFRNPDRPRAGPRAPGGKWVISLSPVKAASMFEELTLALVGGEFDETCEGAPYGVAFSKGDSQVEVWNRVAHDETNEPMLAKLREFVGQEATIEYCPHRASAGHSSPKRGQVSTGA